MAERVVDHLEAVEVHEQQRHQLVAAARGPRHGRGQAVVEQRCAGQPGQRVMVGQIADVLLVALARGDVLNLRYEVAGLVRRGAHQRYAEERVNRVALLVEVALFHGVGLDLAGGQPPHERKVGGQVLGMSQGLKRGLQKLVDRVAQHRGERRIGLQPPPFQRHQRHADGGVHERGLEMILARRQRHAAAIPGVDPARRRGRKAAAHAPYLLEQGSDRSSHCVLFQACQSVARTAAQWDPVRSDRGSESAPGQRPADRAKSLYCIGTIVHFTPRRRGGDGTAPHRPASLFCRISPSGCSDEFNVRLGA